MKKALIAFITIGSLFVYAQDCPDIGVTNQAILVTLLQEKSDELINVKSINLNARETTVTYTTDLDELNGFKYSICGTEIIFEDL